MRMEYQDIVSKISHPTLYDDTPVENEHELCEYLTSLSYDILIVEESIADITIEKSRLNDKIKTTKSSWAMFKDVWHSHEDFLFHLYIL